MTVLYHTPLDHSLIQTSKSLVYSEGSPELQVRCFHPESLIVLDCRVPEKLM
jgi:hypothetical protein